MTDNHDMLLPVMAAALIAHGTSRLVCREGIYHALSHGFIEAARARHAAKHGDEAKAEEVRPQDQGEGPPAKT
jgi:hypothetical protein